MQVGISWWIELEVIATWLNLLRRQRSYYGVGGEYQGSLRGSNVGERKIKIKTNDALESHLMTSRPN